MPMFENILLRYPMSVPIIGAIGMAIGLLKDGLDIFQGDKKVQAEIVLQELQNAHSLAQSNLEVNRVEAQSSSFFVSAWRPAVGWVCVLGLVYEYLIRPILIWVTLIYYPTSPIPPSLDSVLLELLGALLGLGAMITTEKMKGVSRK